jgi:uncharacterized protein (TIGR03437 family)
MRIPVVMLTMVLLAMIPVLASAAPPSSLQFVPTPNSTARGVVPMPNAGIAVFGTVNNNGCVASSPGSCDQTQTPLLSILSPDGTQTAALASSALGSGNSNIAGVAIDAIGNFWVVGQTDSDDFPLVQPRYSKKAAYKQTGFVAKLGPGLNILFSTFLGGQPALGQTNLCCVAVDALGNVFVAGSTDDPNFPTTGPVFGVGTPTLSGPAGGPVYYTFVVKIASQQLSFSRLLGGNSSSGGTGPTAVAVGPDGSLTIAGSTTAGNFPITANVYQGGSGGFVSRISADGSQLIWSTWFGFPSEILFSPYEVSIVNSVAVDAANNVYLTGASFGGPIATTPGALQPNGADGFVVKLSADATQLLFATNLSATVAGVALDPAGNAWVTGHTDAFTFPSFASYLGVSVIPPCGLDFALELNSTATAVQQVFTFLPPTATQPPAFDSTGNLLLLAPAGNLVRLNPVNALTAPAVFAMTNSAIPQATAGVGPGELVTLYGVGLGPAVGITGEPDVNGLYPTQLAGVSVKVNAVAAPLLYARPNQINFQMPFFGTEGSGPAGRIDVTTPGGSLLPALLPQGVYRSIGVFVAVNQDFTANTPSNPAAVGSIVSLYLTGLGGLGEAPNGAISQSANNAFQDMIEVTATFNGPPLGVLYAGTAPELINGVDQVNVQLPAGVDTCPRGICSTGSGIGLVVKTRLGPAVTSNTVIVYTH